MRIADYTHAAADDDGRVVGRELTAALFTAPDTRAVHCLGAVRVRMRYDAANPYAIELHVFNGRVHVPWCMARDLLVSGLRAETGKGDVRVTPGATKVRVILSSPDGRCALFFYRADLVDALAATAAVVPYGAESEWFDWDREIARLGEVA